MAALTTGHIERLIPLKADRPAAANRLRKTLKILMAHAVKTNMRSDNPTTGVKKLRNRSFGFRTWTEEEIAQYYKVHPRGRRARLAMDLPASHCATPLRHHPHGMAARAGRISSPSPNRRRAPRSRSRSWAALPTFWHPPGART